MSRAILALASTLWVALCIFPAFAQQRNETTTKPALQDQSPAGDDQMNMPGMNMPTKLVDKYLMQQASGTGVNPQSAPMEMLTKRIKSWTLRFHGLTFINEVQQTGPRGGDKFFSTNWFMGMAEHRAGSGSLLFRAMTSLEPATATERRYPELFQTGETAFGKPIVDGQHPHDFVMELSMQYAMRLGEKTIMDLYLAPVGDPALGPVAFPHRISAAELPQAALSHHLQDSTHIADEVITAGLARGMMRLEASGFHGGEPNENRWNMDHGAVDSWSARLTLTPSENWSGQVSVGRLKRPEVLDSTDIVRSTASVTYNKPLPSGHWASSLIWGRNHKTANHSNINSYLAESVFQFQQKNYLTGRIELVDKDELLDDQFGIQSGINQPLGLPVGSVFRIAAFTLGYTRDFSLLPGIQTGFGGNFTLYRIPSAIRPLYGDRPSSVIVYLRFRLKGNAPAQHNH